MGQKDAQQPQTASNGLFIHRNSPISATTTTFCRVRLFCKKSHVSLSFLMFLSRSDRYHSISWLAVRQDGGDGRRLLFCLRLSTFLPSFPQENLLSIRLLSLSTRNFRLLPLHGIWLRYYCILLLYFSFCCFFHCFVLMSIYYLY